MTTRVSDISSGRVGSPDANAARMCLVTTSATLLRRMRHTGAWPQLSVTNRLAGLLDVADCDVYVIDTRIPDMGIWPAPLLRHPVPSSRLWVFLVSKLAGALPLDGLPSNNVFLERSRNTPNDLVSLISKRRDPASGREIAKVTHLREQRLFVVRMGNGKTYLLGVDELTEADPSVVIRVRRSPDHEYFTVTQESGNRFEVPWDAVLYHCEPTYEYYKDRGEEVVSAVERAVRIGEAVRRLREERGLTVTELAGRAGMQRPNLSRLESGKHEPSLHTLERVADALEVPVVDLVAR